MGEVSKKGRCKVLHNKLSFYPCGNADTGKDLTISCPDRNARFKTALSDYGSKKFKANVLKSYNGFVL